MYCAVHTFGTLCSIPLTFYSLTCRVPQLSLYENAPVPDAELAEQELYDAALAHIWEGYTQRWPNRE